MCRPRMMRTPQVVEGCGVRTFSHVAVPLVQCGALYGVVTRICMHNPLCELDPTTRSQVVVYRSEHLLEYLQRELAHHAEVYIIKFHAKVPFISCVPCPKGAVWKLVRGVHRVQVHAENHGLRMFLRFGTVSIEPSLARLLNLPNSYACQPNSFHCSGAGIPRPKFPDRYLCREPLSERRAGTGITFHQTHGG